MSHEIRRAPAQPHRVSNSFSKKELEALSVALQRTEITEIEAEALTKVIHAALAGSNIQDLVRSPHARRAFTKLELLKQAKPLATDLSARETVMQRVTKMLEQARLQDVIQAGPDEGEMPCRA